MDNSASQKSCRGPNYAWNDNLVRQLVDMLLAYQRKNPKQAYNWGNISEEFFRTTGTTGTKDVCRNKFEAMKKEFKAWNLLRNAETGLGWDESTRMITASKEWWDRKIKEDANCKKYRTKGMDVWYEELLSSLFRGNVATGRLARSSGMDREPEPEAELEPDNELEPETDTPAAAVDLEGLGTDRGFFRTFVETVTEDRASSQSGVGEDRDDDPVQPTQTPVPTPEVRVTAEKAPVKRRRRQSVGSSRFEEHLAHTRANSDKMVAILQEEVNSHEKAAEDKVKTYQDIIERMVVDEKLVKPSPLWLFAVSMNKSKQESNIFLSLCNDADRLEWLKYEFEKIQK